MHMRVYNRCTSETIEKRLLTRKLSYRKDDRAMHPVYGCPEEFQDPWLVRRLLFPSIDLANVRSLENLTFVALPVPEIIAIRVLGGVANP